MNRIEALRLAVRAIEYMITHLPMETEHYYNDDSNQYKAAMQTCAHLASAKAILRKEIEAHTIYPDKVIT